MVKNMNNNFHYYKAKELEKYFSVRADETKIGEQVQTIDGLDPVVAIKNSSAKYILIGIPEDIGIRANFGKPGATTAWEQSLSALLSMQSNQFLNGEEILVLGYFDFAELLQQSENKNSDELRAMTAQIDEIVYQFIQSIYKNGKELTRVLDGVWLSNRLAWSKDGKTMFYIDTMAKSIDTFDYADGQLSNRKVRWRIKDDSQGLPDGMCIDAEDGIWVAFWSGSCLRRFDKDFNITDVIEMPVPMVTSCAFVGPDFKQMVITSAHDGVANPGKDWGKTYICTPKVPGVAPTLFPN